MRTIWEGGCRRWLGAVAALGMGAALALTLHPGVSLGETAGEQVLVTQLSGESSDVPEGYTGWAEDADGERHWYDDGVMARSKEVYDPEDDAWYWFDAEGTLARDKDVWIANLSKWVRYDSDGRMVKGEDYRISPDDGKGHWWYFDPITGEMMKGFVYLENGGRWVYYDDTMGWMLYGEQCLRDDNGKLQWYYLNDVTGAVTYGWKTLDTDDGGTKDVYYAPVTGTMLYGFQTIDGETYYFDEVTGALSEMVAVVPGEGEAWASDSAYMTKLLGKLGQYGSETDWAVVVDKGSRRTAVFHEEGGVWKPTMTCDVVVSGNTFTCGSSSFTVHHKARWYYQDGYDVNDWWVCYWPNYQSWDEGSAGYSLVYYDGLGYDAGQGFHYGYSSAGCVAIPDYDSALYIYANVPEGSSVVIF